MECAASSVSVGSPASVDATLGSALVASTEIGRDAKEKDSLLEAIARATVNEAINLAVAELKSEAMEVSKAASRGGAVEEVAAQLLAGLADSSATRTERRRPRRRCLFGENSTRFVGDGARLVDNAVASSKEILTDGLERMTLSADTGVSTCCSALLPDAYVG
ncbi:unnamed protein product [Hydatigera taeniaeformis]|uniref:I/LWEQ domain-containing protein n=1 Tax=Hydatigena taeniaeformis TaxID=6205 RepID=A0A0R3WVM5_HYDTA|nr:unnamed protein product [Hydatigera taeniaeformis]